jgi:hypothetical protein
MKKNVVTEENPSKKGIAGEREMGEKRVKRGKKSGKMYGG